MKLLALDLGDKWTGSAISDSLGIIAKPYKTIATETLNDFLTTTITTEKISTIVVGLPITLKGTESEQTKKILLHKEQLQNLFPFIMWVLWDERLTSKQAESLKKITTKEEKIQAHSKAAAFILQTYLEHLHFKKNMP